MNRLEVTYYALLREERGCAHEQVRSSAQHPADLYAELTARHGLRLPQKALKVAINNEIQSWDTPLRDGDEVGFLPPVSGG